MDPYLITVLSAVGLAGSGIVAALYSENRSLRKELSDLQLRYQDKYEVVLVEQTKLIATQTAQTNTFTNAIQTFVTGLADMKGEMLKTLATMQQDILRK